MEVDFNKMGGLVPAIVQDARTGCVLMLGYMNEESLKITQERKLVTFWSRSRQQLWTKGETSGNYLQLRDIKVDCDKDTLLVKAIPMGPVCHTGADTCFFEDNKMEDSDTKDFLFYLESIIEDRRDYPVEGSYTNSLFSRGINRIAKKVGEEAVELVIESKDNDKSLLIGEAADLLYHLQVLLTYKDVKLMEVLECLKERHS
ncbi:MAG: bifunctional phosphoribosyl-AMP cyclohydrolase/phosphoribosyl-ATP diphosphatase HisIE [Spirochaetia bacterium]|jgi:phosphoribosyl-ATP pyrophosphohydrolase/phosphoribosyl-AMP cyclohydrolase|nr:bifunctional phosphoribosyl-AMP cyclohydrolase/phosphoribosyl-ATP diphosphatase HisIE [Spirochaetia bacterium]